MASANNTPASATIGGQSLSPSNESRFVPRSSPHASPASASKRIEDTDIDVDPPNLIDDDRNLIVGATICFTPEASPRNTPMKDTAKKRSALDLTPLELDSALSSNVTDEYIGSIVDGSKVSSSNVILTSSSLDGKSTTSYEVLDKSLEIEDLNLVEEEEEEEEYVNEGASGVNKEEDIDMAAVLENMSPTSSLPSLGSRDGEDEDICEDAEEEAPTQVDDKASITSTPSLKVDSRSLAPFTNLHKFWEGQSITNMSKSIMERILYQAPDPVGTHVRDEADSDQVHSTPAKNTSRVVAGKATSVLSLVGNAVSSYVVSVVVMLGLMTHRVASSALKKAKSCADHVLRYQDSTNSSLFIATMSKLCSFVFSALDTAKHGVQTALQRKNVKAVDPEAADEDSAAQAPVATTSSESKLFCDEPAPKAVSQLSVKEEDKDTSTTEEVVEQPLDAKELERLRKINSWTLHLVATFSKLRSATMQFLSSLSGRFFLSFVIAFIVLAELRMFQRSNMSPKDVVAWDTLICVDSDAATFDSIPVWEYILSPSTFGDASSKPNEYRVHIFTGMSILGSMIFAYLRKKMSTKSGYWLEKEHLQFLKAYAQHGKDWKAVAKHIPSRSIKQVQSHGNYWLSVRSPDKTHPFSPKSIKVKKVKMEGFSSPQDSHPLTSPVRRVKILHTPMTGPVKRAKMRLLDKGGQDTSEE